jgi:hypothetical protein
VQTSSSSANQPPAAKRGRRVQVKYKYIKRETNMCVCIANVSIAKSLSLIQSEINGTV